MLHPPLLSSDHWHTPLIVLGLLVSEGVSTELFLFAVGGMGSAIVGLAGVVHMLYRKRVADLEAENLELRKRLDAYGSLAPDIVSEVRAMLGPLPPSTPNDSSGLPYPYGRSRPTRRPPRQIGGPR